MVEQLQRAVAVKPDAIDTHNFLAAVLQQLAAPMMRAPLASP